MSQESTDNFDVNCSKIPSIASVSFDQSRLSAEGDIVEELNNFQTDECNKVKTKHEEEPKDEEVQIYEKCPARKRLKLDLSNSMSDIAPSEVNPLTEMSHTSESDPPLDICCESRTSMSSQVLVDSQAQENELMELRAEIKEKEETLRQLKLLQTYQKKNSLEELEVLTDSWKKVAQAAATDLYDFHKSSAYEDLTMEDFLQKMDIDPSLIDME